MATQMTNERRVEIERELNDPNELYSAGLLHALCRELLAALPAERQAGFDEAREAAAQLVHDSRGGSVWLVKLIRALTSSTETPQT